MTLSNEEYIQINQALFTLAHAYESRMAKEYPPDQGGLTLYDCAVLMVLGQFEPINSRELSRRMDVSPSTISVYIRRLTKKSLVQMRQDQDDRRNWWLNLTDPGHLVYQAITSGTVQYTRDIISSLDDEEQKALHRLLRKVSHSLGFTWQ